jgi:hypothetical protein
MPTNATPPELSRVAHWKPVPRVRDMAAPRIAMKDQLIVFDAILRDRERSPGPGRRRAGTWFSVVSIKVCLNALKPILNPVHRGYPRATETA